MKKLIKLFNHNCVLYHNYTTNMILHNNQKNINNINNNIDLSEGDINLSINRQKWQNENLNSSDISILNQDSEYFLHQSLSTPCVNVISECENIYLIDKQGRKIMDFHGNSVHQIGFSNEYVIERIYEQMKKLSFCTRRYTNEVAIEFAEKLISISDEKLNKVLLCPSGTGAVGMALKLARVVTGKYKTISMWDSFHGASLDCISVTGEAMFRKSGGPLLSGNILVPPPDDYRCMFKCKSGCNLSCVEYIEYILEREEISALISEPIRWVPYIPKVEYWKRIREACDKNGTLLIFDEIPNSLGRTGRGWFTYEMFDVVPDVLVIGKGLGGGILPIAGILTKSEFNEECKEIAIGHYTHEKNPVCCMAGIATLEYIENNNLIEKSKQLGEKVLKELLMWKEEYSFIGDVRGIGLLIGIELVKDKSSKERDFELAEEIMYKALSLGLSFKLTMGNIITLCPPLIISEDQMEEALNILKQCFNEITEK